MLRLRVGGGAAVVALTFALDARGRGLQRGDGLAADRAARGELGGALEALDRADGGGTELAVDLDGEAGLAEGLLQFADIRSAGAGAQGAVAEMRAVVRLASAAGAATVPKHRATAKTDMARRRIDGGTTAGTPFFGRLRG